MERRRMLRRLMAGSVSLTVPWKLFAGQAERSEGWLEAIAGRRHRVFLDIRSFRADGTGFRKARNLIRALVEAHGSGRDEIGIAFGAGNDAIAHVLGGAAWREYPLGKSLSVSARSGEEARSLSSEPDKWAGDWALRVRELREEGVVVLACQNSLRRYAREFATASGETPDVVYTKLLAALHPGVEPVPAMIAAAVLAQERSVSYIAIG